MRLSTRARATALGGALVLAGCGGGAPVGATPDQPVTAGPVTATTGAASTTTTTPSTTGTAAPPSSPRLPVEHATVTVVDPSRATVSRGRRLAPSRALAVTVAAPASPGPWPLILFAHGFQLGPPAYAHLIDTVAAAGYVVAAPSFPLADAGGRHGADIDRADIPNQSGDLRVVADALTAGPTRNPRIDPGRIGAVGHSDGADTVLDLGFHRDRRDDRVRAVVAIAADAVPLPGAGSAAPAPVLLLVHGDRDRITPYAESQALFGRLPGARHLLTLEGADHLPPVQGAAPWADPLLRAVLAVLDGAVAGRPATPGDDLAAVPVPGVARLQSAD
jgi:predicted dienelactone hydrolase